MPIFAVNFSEKLYLAIRDQIEKGHYQSLESFLEVAAHNQLALERGKSPDQLLAGDHRKQTAESQPVRAATAVVAREESGRREKAAKPAKKRRRKKFVKAAANKKEPETAPAPAPVIEADAVLSRWS